MYILLTPKMKTKIREGDEFLNYKTGNWEMPTLSTGMVYTEYYRPARRKITTLEELGEVLRCSKQSA